MRDERASSFIPKGGGHGRGPGGHRHGPGGHGPAARMMGGEKARPSAPTMRRMLSFMGQFAGHLLVPPVQQIRN